MNKRTVALLLAFLITFGADAQEKWNLKSVVEYAMQHNIGVRQADVQSRMSKLSLNQSRLSQWPSAVISGGVSVNSGSNQDPTSFERITQTYTGASVQLQSSAEIFNFFSKRNTILGNEWEWRASQAAVDKQRYDIALAAANAYLQILLAREQQQIAELQISQTNAQLINTRKQVEAGNLPQLNVAQMEVQLAMDSGNYITARGNVELATLQLKALMNIDAAAAFEVETPPVSAIPLEPIGELQPEYVYRLALQNQPQQRVNDFRLKAAEKFAKAAKAARLPTLGGFGSLASAYNNQSMHITGVTTVFPPIGNVNVGGVSYEVFPLTPLNSYEFDKTSFGTQLSDNFRQSIGLSLSIPLFNGGILRHNYLRSKLNIESVELQKVQDDQNLKQDIYQAYTAAVTALENFNASARNVSMSEMAFDFATRRYEVGMLGTFEYITEQNNLFRARLENTINQFDYVFKMKVLEFYKGEGLKL